MWVQTTLNWTWNEMCNIKRIIPTDHGKMGVIFMWLIYTRFIHFQNNHFKETINYNNVLDHILQKNTGRNQINSIFFSIIIFFTFIKNYLQLNVINNEDMWWVEIYERAFTCNSKKKIKRYLHYQIFQIYIPKH